MSEIVVDFKKNVAFYMAFLLDFSWTFLKTTMLGESIPQALTFVEFGLVCALLTFSLITKRFKSSDFLMLLLLLFLSTVILFVGHYLEVLKYILFIFAVKDVNLKSVLKIFLYLGMVYLLSTVVLSILNIIPNLVYIRDGKSRMSLGIIYPTDFAAHVFSLVVVYGLLNVKKIKNLQIVGILILAIIINKLTDARLDVALIVLVAVLLFMQKYTTSLINKIAEISWITMIVGFITILLATIRYQYYDQFLGWLDHLLSGRLSLGQQALQNYGVHLFGSKTISLGWGGTRGFQAMQFAQQFGISDYSMIDSSYMRMIIMYGVAFSIIFTLFFSLKLWTLTKNGRKLLVLFIALYSISAVVDQHFLELCYNPFILALFADSSYFIAKRETNSNF